MKTALLTLALVGGFVGAQHVLAPCCREAAAADAVDEPLQVAYVEARSASVFAGACHYSSEFTTQGRRAVLGLSITAGTLDGAELSGTALVCAVAADGNLAEGGARRSVVYLDRDLQRWQADLLLAFCRRELGDVLGTIDRVERVPVRVAIEGERYALSAGGAVALEGALDPDRACCSMPQNVWYRPLVDCADALVGRSERFAFDVDRLGAPFERHDENSAFVGRLTFGAGCPAPAPAS